MNKSSASSRSESRDEITSHDNNKGLKMKIKRKAPPQQNLGVKPEGSSKHEIVKPGIFGSSSGGSGSSGSATTADRHDSNSNSSSSSSASSAGPTTAAPKTANPFEKLKQAILEQEKSKQQKQLHKPGGSGDKDKSGKDSGGQGHGGSSGFGSVYSRGASSALSNSNDSGLHNKRELKSDPYEFNAKNEDRLASSLSSTKKLKQEKEKMEMKDVMTDTSHIAIMTDPDCLGPCEPGTSVVLEGIVWQETENGLLVVNVTWRGKTYVGTLLDATKHEWAPPTFRSDSPNDPDARTPRTRGKRGRTTMNSMGGRGTRSTRNSNQSSNNPPPSPAKSNSASAVGEKRKQDLMNEIAAASPAKKLKIDEDTPRPPNVVVEETWYVCFHVDCNKRYKEISALKYHQNHAHKTMLLSREQNSEHNKTHVNFTSASSQQHHNIAAQTDGNEKTPKESSKKNKKSKKSKKNKTGEAMEIDQTSVNSNHVNVKQTDTLQSVTNPNALTLPNATAKSSDSSNVSLKQPRIQLTPLAVQQSGAAKTVMAPLVAVPLATQTQNSQTSLASLSEKEKKREKKKRKREKKEKKLLLEQQQMQQKENGQKLVNNSGVSQQNNANALSLQNNTAPPAHIMNRSPPDGNKSRSMGVLASQSHAMPAQRQLPLNTSDRNKTDDPSSKQVSLKDNSANENPAYSDISDEGNDNVPVLENEVELAKKQHGVHTASRPKETNNEPVAKSSSSSGGSVGPVQEPPNLTPVITHTGHSKAALPTGPTQTAQMYPNKDLTQSNHINSAGVRNVPSTSTNADLNRPREAAFANRAGNENIAKPSPNEMHQKRVPSISGGGVSQQSHPVFANYPQGYNLNHVVNSGSTKSGVGATAVPISSSQDRMAQQKAKEDSLKGRSMVSPNLATTKLSPKLPGGIPVTSQSRMDNSRPIPTSSHQQRHVDSNMNMQQKLSMAVSNGPPMPPHINKGGNPPPSVADINKQVASLSNAEVRKSNLATSEQHKRLTDGIISDRQSENEKILKENIELKTQMNEKDKDKSQIMFEQQQQQKNMHHYAAYMQQQQNLRAMQQHQFQRNRPMEQVSKAKVTGQPVDRPQTDLHLSPTKTQQTPSSQSSPHPLVSNIPRRDSSPMPSPKTKAELKQGERKENSGGKVEPRTPGEHKRPESVERNPPDGARASAMKSPGPSPSMSSSAPPPGAVPPGHYPYPYPGFIPYPNPYMFPGAPHPYMSYDSKALEMLQQHASQYYNSQNKAQDLRKLPDRKSPNPDSERSSAASEKRESPSPMTRSPQIPHPIPGHPAVSLPQWFMPNGPVPMMQQSPQQPSSKH